MGGIGPIFPANPARNADPVFDVKDYGAKGDGSDDTAAIQAAATAAIAASGRLVFPYPSSYYSIRDTITLQPASAASFAMDIVAGGHSDSQIRWEGADNKPVFLAYGWKRSSIRGVKVRFPNASTGVVAWDLDVDGTRTSTGNLDFYDCHITAGVNQTSCVGWRYGHRGGALGGTEMSFIAHYGCGVSWNGSTFNTGCIGYVNEHQNGLHYTYHACSASQSAIAFTNNSTAGAASATGGDCMFFVDCGGSNNDIEYQFARGGVYSITGGRWELGRVHMSVPMGGGTIVGLTISEKGVKGAGYNDATAKLFDVGAAANLTVDGCRFVPGTGNFGAAMFTMACGSTGFGTLNIRGGQLAATEPFFTFTSGTWRRNFHGNTFVNSSGQSSAALTSVIDRVTIAAYSRSKAQVGFAAPDAVGLFESTMLPTSQRVYWGRFVPTEDILAAKVSFAYDVGGGSAGDNSLEIALADSTATEIATTGAQADKLLTAGGNTVTLSLTAPVTLTAGSAYYVGWQVYGTINAAIRVVVLNSGSVQSNKIFAAAVPQIEMCRHDVGANGIPGTITVGAGQTQCPKVYVRSS